ncbi:ABC transporter ATP-binding protein [Solibaculum mannosilyticum]|uniref:ABC transporter ATP-binding protein n=1 Tax=Solibaculum mannosilyticum TaxID=2780922 RepID=UPI0007A8E961|nr:ABC transporter ATP-binding protein YxdL [Eubacteriaceae bacterium CHKCI005]
MTPVLELKNIQKVYNPGKQNEVNALRGISLTLEPGDMTAIVGPSGSGKSTLLHIIGCLDRPTGGEYFLGGEEVSRLKDNKLAYLRNQKIGFVLQDFGLISGRSVFENVSVPLLFSRVPYRKIKSKVMGVLESLHIQELVNRRADQLSGGQKQRVAIARAIVMDPDLILADEPTGALDSKTSQDMLEVLQDLNRQGKTLLMVTHNEQMAQGCKTRLTLVDGRFQA